MKLKGLNKKVLTLWYIHAVLWSLLVIGVWLGVFLPLILTGIAPEITLAVALSISIPAVLLLILIFALPYFRFKLYAYSYDELRVTVKLGVIFRKSVVLPVCQIQDIHKFQGPIMMMLGISGVTVSTAGSNFDLAVLTSDEADEMITALEENLNKRVAENAEKKNEEI
jgi:membrane protein YdbS with pleckstrin-like domain